MKYMPLMLVLAAGCRSMSGMEEEATSEDGVIRKYPISQQRALEVARVVLKEQGADSMKEGDGYVIGSFYVNFITPGSYCGVYTKPAGEACEVRVISRRKSSISFFTGLTEGGFHAAFREKLKTLASK